MNPTDEAVTLFERNHACSQAVFMAFSDHFELDHTQARGIAAGFGAGMRTGCTCGAVTGAIMVLGLALVEEWNEASRQTINQAVIELRERFTLLHASDQCAVLLGCNPGTPEGRTQAIELDLFRTICPVFVRDATRLTIELLAENGIDTV